MGDHTYHTIHSTHLNHPRLKSKQRLSIFISHYLSQCTRLSFKLYWIFQKNLKSNKLYWIFPVINGSPIRSTRRKTRPNTDTIKKYHFLPIATRYNVAIYSDMAKIPSSGSTILVYRMDRYNCKQFVKSNSIHILFIYIVLHLIFLEYAGMTF